MCHHNGWHLPGPLVWQIVPSRQRHSVLRLELDVLSHGFLPLRRRHSNRFMSLPLASNCVTIVGKARDSLHGVVKPQIWLSYNDALGVLARRFARGAARDKTDVMQTGRWRRDANNTCCLLCRRT